MKPARITVGKSQYNKSRARSLTAATELFENKLCSISRPYANSNVSPHVVRPFAKDGDLLCGR